MQSGRRIDAHAASPASLAVRRQRVAMKARHGAQCARTRASAATMVTVSGWGASLGRPDRLHYGCGSERVARKDDGGRFDRWNCHGCEASCTVLSRTVIGQ